MSILKVNIVYISRMLNICMSLLNIVAKQYHNFSQCRMDYAFRMAYFEVKGASLSWQQLTDQIQSHYTHQAIQQAYVLILGLDVLGNPYGLIKDFTQGFGDLFYEPFLVSGLIYQWQIKRGFRHFKQLPHPPLWDQIISIS